MHRKHDDLIAYLLIPDPYFNTRVCLIYWVGMWRRGGGEAKDNGEGFSGGGVILNKHEIGYEHGLVKISVTKQPDYHRRNLDIWDL